MPTDRTNQSGVTLEDLADLSDPNLKYDRSVDGAAIISQRAAVASHFIAVRNALGGVDFAKVVEMAHLIKSAWITYIVGNGGSAATASHFAADLVKACGVRALALFDSTPALTAWSNDDGYRVAPLMMLRALHDPGEDAVIVGISTSGDSMNIVHGAVIWAKEANVVSIGLTGAGGGRMAGALDLHVEAPGDAIEVVEDVHSAVCHAVVRMLKCPQK